MIRMGVVCLCFNALSSVCWSYDKDGCSLFEFQYNVGFSLFVSSSFVCLFRVYGLVHVGLK